MPRTGENFDFLLMSLQKVSQEKSCRGRRVTKPGTGHPHFFHRGHIPLFFPKMHSVFRFPAHTFLASQRNESCM